MKKSVVFVALCLTALLIKLSTLSWPLHQLAFDSKTLNLSVISFAGEIDLKLVINGQLSQINSLIINVPTEIGQNNLTSMSKKLKYTTDEEGEYIPEEMGSEGAMEAEPDATGAGGSGEGPPEVKSLWEIARDRAIKLGEKKVGPDGGRINNDGYLQAASSEGRQQHWEEVRPQLPRFPDEDNPLMGSFVFINGFMSYEKVAPEIERQIDYLQAQGFFERIRTIPPICVDLEHDQEKKFRRGWLIKIVETPVLDRMVYAEGRPLNKHGVLMRQNFLLNFLSDEEGKKITKSKPVAVFRGPAEDWAENGAQASLVTAWLKVLLPTQRLTVIGDIIWYPKVGYGREAAGVTNTTAFLVLSDQPVQEWGPIIQKLELNAHFPGRVELQGFRYEIYMTVDLLKRYRYGSWWFLKGTPQVIIRNLAYKPGLYQEVIKIIPNLIYVYARYNKGGATLVIAVDSETKTECVDKFWALGSSGTRPTMELAHISRNIASQRTHREHLMNTEPDEGPWLRHYKEGYRLVDGLSKVEAIKHRHGKPIFHGPSKKVGRPANLSVQSARDTGRGPGATPLTSGGMGNPTPDNSNRTTNQDEPSLLPSGVPRRNLPPSQGVEAEPGEARGSSQTTSADKLSFTTPNSSSESIVVRSVPRPYTHTDSVDTTAQDYSRSSSAAVYVGTNSKTTPSEGMLEIGRKSENSVSAITPNSGVSAQVQAQIQHIADAVGMIPGLSAAISATSQRMDRTEQAYMQLSGVLAKLQNQLDRMEGAQATANAEVDANLGSMHLSPPVEEHEEMDDTPASVTREPPDSPSKRRREGEELGDLNVMGPLPPPTGANPLMDLDISSIAGDNGPNLTSAGMVATHSEEAASEGWEEDDSEVLIASAPSDPPLIFQPSVLPAPLPHCQGMEGVSITEGPKYLFSQDREPGNLAYPNPGNLVVQPSCCFAYGDLAKPTIPMGMGAFATRDLPIGTRIPYVGSPLTREEFTRRMAANQDEFLMSHGTAYQDSREQRAQGEVGSAVNSPLHAWNFKANGPAVSNVELGYSVTTGQFFWRTIKLIRADDEVLGSYGPSYRFRFTVGAHVMAIPARLLTPFSEGTRQGIRERVNRLVVDVGDFSLRWHKAPPRDHHFYDGLASAILNRQLHATLQLIRQSGCTFRLHLRTLRPNTRKTIPGNGYCGWLTAMYCSRTAKGTAIPRKIDWATSRGLLIDWLSDCLRALTLDCDSGRPLGEDTLELIQTMQHTLESARKDTQPLPRDYWLKTSLFPLADKTTPTHLWYTGDDGITILSGSTSSEGGTLTLASLEELVSHRMGGVYSNGHYDLYRATPSAPQVSRLMWGMVNWIHQEITYEKGI